MVPILGAAVGCTTISLEASFVWTQVGTEMREWHGIATSSPIDSSATQIVSAPAT